MYTTEALAVRERLRHDPVVVRVAREFWSTFGKAFSESRDDDQRLLNRLTYVDFHMRLVRALYPPDALTDEASRRLAVDDWASDSRGATRMNFKEFRAALYEIADLWTPSLDASDYVYFLKVLFCRMAFRSQVARVNGLLRRPDTRFQWKPLPQVSNATPFEDYFDVESLDGASTRSDSKRNSLIVTGVARTPSWTRPTMTRVCVVGQGRRSVPSSCCRRETTPRVHLEAARRSPRLYGSSPGAGARRPAAGF